MPCVGLLHVEEPTCGSPGWVAFPRGKHHQQNPGSWLKHLQPSQPSRCPAPGFGSGETCERGAGGAAGPARGCPPALPPSSLPPPGTGQGEQGAARASLRCCLSAPPPGDPPARLRGE